MHPEAHRFIAHTIGQPTSVLEVGSLDINGSPRELVLNCDWYGIDLQSGPGVDEVADAATWQSSRQFDLAICAEVLEHTPTIPEILTMIARHLTTDGRLIVTCATHGRAPHSAIDGGDVRSREHYQNVDPIEFLQTIAATGFTPLRFETHHDRGDLYLLAVKNDG